MFQFFLFLVLLIPTGAVFGQSLPPIGKRIYLIEEKSLYSPVKIEREDNPFKRKGILRDPIPVGKAGLIRRKQMDLRDPNMKPRKESLLKFASLAVSGRLAKPRVDFRLQPLPVGRADQTMEVPLRQKLRTLEFRQEKDILTP